MSHQIYPELGEKFAIVGEVELMEAAGDISKGVSVDSMSQNIHNNLQRGFFKTMKEGMVDAQIRKGTFVITDRRVAFKGSTSYLNTAGLITHLMGSGTRDLSISYKNLHLVEQTSWPINFHLRIGFFDEDSNQEKHVILKIHRWGSGIPDLIENAKEGIDFIEQTGVMKEGMELVPIAGDFLSIAAGIGNWFGGKTAAPQWVSVIQLLKLRQERSKGEQQGRFVREKPSSPASGQRQNMSPPAHTGRESKAMTRYDAIPASTVPTSSAYNSSHGNSVPTASPLQFQADTDNIASAGSMSGTDPEEIIIREVGCITPEPESCLPVEFIISLFNESSRSCSVTVTPLVKHSDQTKVAVAPLNLPVPSKNAITARFGFTPPKKGEYDVEISLLVDGAPGASYFCSPVIVGGDSFEIQSVSLDSSMLYPARPTKILLTVKNTGSSEIVVDSSAVTVSDGSGIMETYFGSTTIPRYMTQAIGGSFIAPRTEGEYMLEVRVRCGREERRHSVRFSVRSSIDAVILGIPDQMVEGKRYMLHVEIENKGAPGKYSIRLTGNCIDETIRQVSMEANERKIVPVEIVARKTMGKGEMDENIKLEGLVLK
jgi:hypothetical protein